MMMNHVAADKHLDHLRRGEGSWELIRFRFLYDLVAGRGVTSLRLKSLTEPFPGRVEGLPPVYFLLIPFPFLGPSGQLDLEVCV
ncbi:hypothetical protein NC651_037469 [Populus alba x Populus x berolinensis]|nr:hypothetical protein NC651_037469 [Populus alba x Populus x berolinensis]